jgi:hypothetical protein
MSEVGDSTPARSELEAALRRVTIGGEALADEVERLLLDAGELCRNVDGFEPPRRASRIAAGLRQVQLREADLELACIALEAALMRCPEEGPEEDRR